MSAELREYCILTDGESPLKIHETRLTEGRGRPGDLLEVKGRLIVETGQGGLELVFVQPPGKWKMSAYEFLKGHALEIDQKLS